MRIVICHNFYQQAGGEDRVFQDETRLLAARGHSVATFTKHNDDVAAMSPAKLALRTVWNRQAARELYDLVREHRSDMVHFHNTLPLISPAAYYAARRAGAAVVQTLHNYRLVCPKATLFRDGGPCELCLGKAVPWPAVQHACYRDNRPASAAVATMLALHRARGTYRNAVDAYIVLSEFARTKMAAGGLPAETMHLRPNFMLDDPGAGSGTGNYVVFVGRLSPEKGLDTLLEAWRNDATLPPLRIVGTGPLSPEVQAAAAGDSRITPLGFLPEAEVLRVIGDATALVLPSLWYEGFPKSIVEAYAKGTPVVASRIGSIAEVVRDGISGACFKPGDSADLAATLRRLADDRRRLCEMRTAARALFDERYSATAAYDRLIEIYGHAMRVRHSRSLLPEGTLANVHVPSVDQVVAAATKRDLLETASHRHETEVCTR